MIELQEIRKVFNAGKPNEHLAVDGVSLTIEAQPGHGAEGAERLGEDHLAEPLGVHGQTHGRPDHAPGPGDHQPAGAVSYRDQAEDLRVYLPAI